MAGLNDLISDVKQESVSLPSWYTAAQQDVANMAKTAAGNVPNLSQTPVQGVVNKLAGADNPFNAGQDVLSSIATGAANPWMTDAAGNTVGNTATPMGGLFEAQRDYLNQIMPDITARTDAAGIGSGQFGSLRNVTASQKARGDALTDLFQKQMTAGLQSQQTGAQAAGALGQAGLQESQAATGLADVMQKYPFTGALNYGNIINQMQAPQTKQTQVQYSPLSQASGILGVLQGTGGVGQNNSGAGLVSGLGSLIGSIGNIFSGSGTTGNITYNPDGSYTTSGGNTINPGDYSNLF